MKHMRLFDKTAIPVCLLIGLLAGVLGIAAGRVVALSMARSDIDAYAVELLARAETIARETNEALAEANQFPGETCGPDDLRLIRKIAFSARYIKDIGRMVDHKLACSSYLGVVVPPFTPPPPDLITAEGNEIWGNAQLQLAKGATALVVQAGDANAVMANSAFLDLERQPFRYAIAVVNPGKKGVLRSWGKPLADDRILIARKSTSYDTASDLLRVECSKRYFLCSTAAVNRQEPIIRQSAFIAGFGALGFLIGGFLSLLGLMFYRTPKPLVARLKDALRLGELTLVFQPIVNLKSGRIVSAEALVRWTDRDGKSIPPDVFVSAAESNGTAGEITTYVLHQVGKIAGPLLRDHHDLVVTINIVAADLSDPNFYRTLADMVRASGIANKQIGIELTERSTVEQEIAVPAIARLRELGHPVYLDDFGTGYSSLAHLQDLNVDVLKLDKAFTDTIGTESVKVSIVPQILEMAKALSIGVVVEGIESGDQYAYFASADCRCNGQGWMISRPLSFDSLVSFAATH